MPNRMKRKPKEGDQCICGALFEDGRWWNNYLTQTHDGHHEPLRVSGEGSNQ